MFELFHCFVLAITFIVLRFHMLISFPEFMNTESFVHCRKLSSGFQNLVKLGYTGHF